MHTPGSASVRWLTAHQYIAAELNQLNGASFTDAQAAFDEATALLSTYTPSYVAGLKGKAGKALTSKFVALASSLDDYNNGVTGPGHCSE